MKTFIYCLILSSLPTIAYSLVQEDSHVFIQVNRQVESQPEKNPGTQHPIQNAPHPKKEAKKPDSKHFEKKDKDFDRARHDHDRYPVYQTVIVIPTGFERTNVDGQVYYYKEGVFYQLNFNALLPVDAPIGAVVDSLPMDRSYATVDGIDYIIYNNTYYVRTDQGHYQVVELPTSDLGDITTVTANSNSVVVTIPNSDSDGSTTVTLVKSEGGFIGPQEEFYSEFPSISQLKAMYGK